MSDSDKDDNEKIPYAHRMALISDKQFMVRKSDKDWSKYNFENKSFIVECYYFQQARTTCHGEYVNTDPNNVQCLYALHLINEVH